MITHTFEFISKPLFCPFYFFPVSFTFLSCFFRINIYLSHCFVAWINGVDSLWGCARGLLEYSCTVFKGPSSWVVYLHYRHWILGLRSDSYMKWGKGWPFYLRSFTGSCSCLDFVVVAVWTKQYPILAHSSPSSLGTSGFHWDFLSIYGECPHLAPLTSGPCHLCLCQDSRSTAHLAIDGSYLRASC